MTENMLDAVKAGLEASRGHWPEIAKETGLGYFTLTNIAQGKVADPRISTVQKLYDYFRSREQVSA